MTRLETFAVRLKKAALGIAWLTGTYSITVDVHGAVEVLLLAKNFNELPGAAAAKTEERKSRCFPFYKTLEIGGVAFTCLMELDPDQPKEGA